MLKLIIFPDSYVWRVQNKFFGLFGFLDLRDFNVPLNSLFALTP